MVVRNLIRLGIHFPIIKRHEDEGKVKVRLRWLLHTCARHPLDAHIDKIISAPRTVPTKPMSQSNPQNQPLLPNLLGKDDSEFLNPLRKLLKLKYSVQPVPLVNLFGTEDAPFLEALSRITGWDMLQYRETYTCHVESRKRKHFIQSKGFHISLDALLACIQVHDVEAEPSYTNPDIYGPSKFHGRGEYIPNGLRVSKL